MTGSLLPHPKVNRSSQPREMRSLKVAMRDGIHLAIDIYLPAGPGPFPVLLERTPYGKTGSNRADRTAADPAVQSKPQIARIFADFGYAYVLQDCRGRYDSEGSFTKYLNEGEDGEDTLAWVLRQPWCNGDVGTLGLSYGAHVQAALASSSPQGLKAMFLDSGGFSSAYHSGIRQGGAFELKQLTWAFKHALLAKETAADADRRQALEAEDIRDWMGVRWRRNHSPIAAAPEYESYVLEQWDRDTFEPFWRQRGIFAAGFYEKFADVPQVHMSSWYDPYAKTAVDNFRALSRLKSSPVRLVMGPWTHGQRSITFAGDVDFGPAAPLDGNLADDYVSLRRRWFDYHLRGLPVDDPLPSPVTYFVMGGGSGRRNEDGRLQHGGRWKHATAWPPPETSPLDIFLHDGGDLLSDPPAAAELRRSFISDPASPVPTIGGAIASGAPVMQAGAFDQRETAELFGAAHPGRPLDVRNDVIAFRSAPLKEDVELTGTVLAELFLSCDTPDADVTLKLIDEYPPSADYPEGFAMNLTHAILRLRFRHSFKTPEPMQPTEIYPVSLETFPTSNLFKAGHRIRVDIAGSNFPHFDVNANTDWRDPAAKARVATIHIHCNRDHPSRLVLPISHES